MGIFKACLALPNLREEMSWSIFSGCGNPVDSKLSTSQFLEILSSEHFHLPSSQAAVRSSVSRLHSLWNDS